MASSNWLALKTKIAPKNSTRVARDHNRDRQASSSAASASTVPSTTSFAFVRGHRTRSTSPTAGDDQVTQLPLPGASQHFSKAAAEYLTQLTPTRGNSLLEMRQLVQGTFNSAASSSSAAGKYVALDCEMVGIGPGGVESALARVSLVDYHGRVLLDAFVRPREQVTDWRTHVSGVREEDMRNAREFDDVQKTVAQTLQNRILVGHALSNDLSALLLSHSRAQTRDTQHYCGKLKLAGRLPALRNLARLHFGIDIQKGEHSSVTDARAAMAIYRVHSKTWEQLARGHTPTAAGASSATASLADPEGDPESDARRLAKLTLKGTIDGDEHDGITLHLATPHDDTEDGWEDDDKDHAAAPAKRAKLAARHTSKSIAKSKQKSRTRISSGLSTVVRGSGGQRDKRSTSAGGGGRGVGARTAQTTDSGGEWWKSLGGSSKGGVRI
ncbi:ribonuclease H-like protein, partial [Auriculariales sp. MPI-PUGE-AT-0066]